MHLENGLTVPIAVNECLMIILSTWTANTIAPAGMHILRIA